MILFTGPIYDSSGYAVAGRSVVRLLKSLGHDVRTFPKKDWSLLGPKLPEETQGFLGKLELFDNETVDADFLLVYNTQSTRIGVVPVRFNRFEQVVHTMFETDQCPEDWVDNLNLAQHVFVPSHWGVDVFKNSGVKNVNYMPFYIDVASYHPDTPKLIKDIPGFKFMFVGDLTPRKNMGDVVKAYLNTFRNNEDVALILKVWVGNREKLRNFVNEMQAIRKYVGCGPRIPRMYVYNELTPEAAMPGFINSCDCLVMPSCGEGFGLPHLYAMSCEKPIISTNWSACGEYITDENSLPLQYDIKPVPYPIIKIDKNFFGHQWASPSLEHLALLLKWVYENQSELPAIGKKARQTVIDKFSLPVVRGLMKTWLTERGIA